jgi:glycyl-tRNA synthetase beta chain
VPTAPVTVAVSLADKLDTLLSFFGIRETPSGSRDPFALRRAALAVIRLLVVNELQLKLISLIVGVVRDTIGKRIIASAQATMMPDLQVLARLAPHELERNLDDIVSKYSKDESVQAEIRAAVIATFELIPFFADRLKVQQREAGVRHDLIDAVFALGGEDDLVRLLARVHALQAFIGTEDGANLLVGYRRAANILKKEGWAVAQQPNRHPGLVPGAAEPQAAAPVDERMPGQARHDDLGYTPEPAEAALIAALDAAAPAAADAVAREDFEAAMAALATLRAPIDAFFDAVTVNDANPDKRTARLALLARIRDAVHGVADFSKIEG